MLHLFRHAVVLSSCFCSLVMIQPLCEASSHEVQAQSFQHLGSRSSKRDDDPGVKNPDDEVHDGSLPANSRKIRSKEEQDKYYNDGLHHVPE